jgi:hypothetical protein
MKKIKNIFWALCAALLVFCGCSAENGSGDWLIKIDGKSVSRMEYLIYLKETVQNYELIGGDDIWDTDFDGRTAEDVAKESAFNSLVAVKIAIEKADKYSASLSETDESRAEMEALQMSQNAGEEKDSEFYKTALNVVKEKYLYNYVKENLTKSIKIASAQTDAFCNENRDKYRRNLEYIQGKAYYFDTTEEAQNYAQTGEGTENAVYSEDLSGTWQEIKEKFSMDENTDKESILGPFETEEGYAIINIENTKAADEKTVEETMRSDYESSVKSQYFADEANKWLQNADIKTNEKMWNEIKIEDAKG